MGKQLAIISDYPTITAKLPITNELQVIRDNKKSKMALFIPSLKLNIGAKALYIVGSKLAQKAQLVKAGEPPL